MTSAPLCSILIVNWNARDFLQACLKSIPTDALPLEILVVDNASTDGSVALLEREFSPERFPQIKVIANPTNLGFAAANNLAARCAHGKYLFLLNPDTTLAENTLHAMIQFAEEHPRVGALGPALRNPDGSLQRSCWRGYPGLAMAFSDALFLWKVPWLPLASASEYRSEELRAPRAVDHLLGACMLIRREAWESVGGLDEDYFLFLEETDWCWRAQRAGWDIYYLPQVAVTHYGQQSMRRFPQRNVPQFYKSYIRFYRMHHSVPSIGVFALKMIIALACLIRIGMWQLRRMRAEGGKTQKRATAMAAGYWQTLQQLGSF